jgi:hypothetical protein
VIAAELRLIFAPRAPAPPPLRGASPGDLQRLANHLAVGGFLSR